MNTKTLRQLREEHGYRQEDVASHLGIKKNSYNAKELGHRRVTLNEARALAALYQVRVEDIEFPAAGVRATRTA